MKLKAIPAGNALPDDIHVVIEVPQGSSVKYEVEKGSEAIFVDRFLFTAMHYPLNYGFIPNTLSDDGDPTDVLVVSPQPVAPGSVLRARPVGVLVMEDEKGMDMKIIAVPHAKVAPGYEAIQDVKDLPQALLDQVRHFFEHYKDLEPGKWVKLKDWSGVEAAREIINKDVARFPG
ncbi:inorganic diphosphatase [Acidithiobacillus sp. IBUN Pt1247-S3]|uniref:inorganic diphosphatase n=1 Tax=Acidithiobacillus sp. IBUN Pt1247-S3 TaxID=3166642 RepID=UPI0034E464E9